MLFVIVIFIAFASYSAFAVSINEHLLGAESIECHPVPHNGDTILSYVQPAILTLLPEAHITSFKVVSTPFISTHPLNVTARTSMEYEYQTVRCYSSLNDCYLIGLTSLPIEIQQTWHDKTAAFGIILTIYITNTRQIQSSSQSFLIKNARVVHQNVISLISPPQIGDTIIHYKASFASIYECKDDQYRWDWIVRRDTDPLQSFRSGSPDIEPNSTTTYLSVNVSELCPYVQPDIDVFIQLAFYDTMRDEWASSPPVLIDCTRRQVDVTIHDHYYYRRWTKVPCYGDTKLELFVTVAKYWMVIASPIFEINCLLQPSRTGNGTDVEVVPVPVSAVDDSNSLWRITLDFNGLQFPNVSAPTDLTLVDRNGHYVAGSIVIGKKNETIMVLRGPDDHEVLRKTPALLPVLREVDETDLEGPVTLRTCVCVTLIVLAGIILICSAKRRMLEQTNVTNPAGGVYV
eukprot:970253_1